MMNSLVDYLLNSVKLCPNKIAVIYNDQQLSFEELFYAAKNLSAYLQLAGIRRGDRVVVCLGNCLETIISFWAILMANAVVSIIDNKQSPEKITAILQNSTAAAVIVSENKKFEFINGYDSFKNLLLIEQAQLEKIFQQGCVDKNISIGSKHLDIDLASIIYTSGSTGEPKGIMLTHRNMLAASHSINTYLDNSNNEKVLSALPLSFDYGLYQMIMMVAVGGTLILENDFLLPSRFLKLIETYQVSAVPVVPSMAPLLKQFHELKAYDLACVRYVTNTGAALMQQHIAVLQQLFTHARIFSMYGLTECKRCTYLPPEDLARKPDSVGIPIPNTEMWIVNEEGERLNSNQTGEIVVRGQTVMRGYWNNPQATSRKLKPGLLPGEFVLHTGDYGRLDEDGYFYFLGRMDEIIKSRGMKVSPKEIEIEVTRFPNVIEAAVVPVEHTVYGVAIVLFVSAMTANYLSTVKALCKQRLQPQQQPIEIFVLNALPKTTNGKIDKQLLKTYYKNTLSAAVA
jgi:amino acid adenylation domain-containing protein